MEQISDGPVLQMMEGTAENLKEVLAVFNFVDVPVPLILKVFAEPQEQISEQTGGRIADVTVLSTSKESSGVVRLFPLGKFLPVFVSGTHAITHTTPVILARRVLVRSTWIWFSDLRTTFTADAIAKVVFINATLVERCRPCLGEKW